MLVVGFLFGTDLAASAATLRVPAEYPTIQTAVTAAASGDVVLVSPGTYREQVEIGGKSITLASEFLVTRDPSAIGATVIESPAGPNAITIQRTVAPQATVVGFTLRNVSGSGVDGIRAVGPAMIENNHLSGFVDALDLEPSHSGPATKFVVRDNVIENNADDAVDLDGPITAAIEGNVLKASREDGIEIRLHEHLGRLDIAIRGNTIEGNRGDGVQVIDEAGVSDRVFTIERNLFLNNGKAGLGLLDDGDTSEDFRAASLLDEIRLFNNTFVGHSHAVSGGDNLVAVNNIFANASTLGLKGVDGNSIAAYNLFWGNGADAESSNVDPATTVTADPLLAVDYTLLDDSRAIDAGTAVFDWRSTRILDLPAGSFSGVAPDLGARERTLPPSPPETVITDGPPRLSNSTSADFGFSSSEPGSTFACALDGTAFEACSSPWAYASLGDGSHTFEVRASDPGGSTDPTPAIRVWTVDTRPPETTISSAPADPANASSASFGFGSSEPGSTFACALDGAESVACSSPTLYEGLAEGPHTFTVAATDEAGNTDPDGASHTWTIAAPSFETLTFAPEADAYVARGEPNRNFGTRSSLDADLSPNTESYLRFAVTGVAGTVISATLRLSVTSETWDGPALYAAENSWSETDVTWNARPALTSGVIDNKAAVETSWVEYDVLPLVGGDGTYTFGLTAESSNGLTVRSREASGNGPELVLAVRNG